jgi:NhaP-type Na+/H+ or K+/H+ antiporter
MSFDAWVLVVGALLLLMGLGSPYVSRLPFSLPMIYLGIGMLLGPLGWGVLDVSPLTDRTLFYRASEITVVISLFSVGLKLRLPLRDPRWGPSLVLAFGAMTLNVGLITLLGYFVLHWSLGAAVLLGAILAPTDPVLAAEVQLTHARDGDELRRALSGEAGFNDGTAFPFVMLGLGLLGLHDLGAGGWRWWSIDVAWSIVGGLGIGALLGDATGRLILYLRIRCRESVALDEYLLLGLIGLAYGTALLLHTYGFLAVFSAGVALRAIERRQEPATPPDPARFPAAPGEINLEAAKDPQLGPAYLASAFLNFNNQLERILEVGVVVLIGAGLVLAGVPAVAWWFVPVLFLIVRPLSVLPVAWTGRLTGRQLAGVGWFGLRGIGSIYYLMYAAENGLSDDLVRTLTGLTFGVIAASVVIHGISVLPVLRFLQSGQRRRREKDHSESRL